MAAAIAAQEHPSHSKEPAVSSSLEGTQELVNGSEGLSGTLKSIRTKKEDDTLSIGSEFASFSKNLGISVDQGYLNKLPRYLARYRFKGQRETDLSLEPGTVVYVEKKRKSGWWVCIAEGRRGLVPHNYLSELKDPTEPPKPILVEEFKEPI